MFQQRLVFLRCSVFLLFLCFTTTRVKCSSSKHSKRTYGSDGEILSEEDLITECYQFTWMGPEEENTNSTLNCDVYDALDQPCFEPLVWTSGTI